MNWSFISGRSAPWPAALALAGALVFCCPVHAQQIVVIHVHSGTGAHRLQLQITGTTLLISGPQEFRDVNGMTGYCSFPTEIPLENLVSADYKFVKVSLKMFTSLDDAYNIGELHLQYKDTRGKQKSLTFIPADAQRNNTGWTGGNGDTLNAFADALRGAITNRSAHAADPVQPGAQPPVLASSEKHTGPYYAQMWWKDFTKQVVVWPVSPDDPTHILVKEEDGGERLLDIGLDGITSVEAKQKTVSLAAPYQPGQPITIFSVGGQAGPKIYNLCLKVAAGNKNEQACLISATARCAQGKACAEGSDGGRSILELERGIRAALEQRRQLLAAQAAEQARRNALPPEISAAVTFDDNETSQPDQRLDAGKSAVFQVVVANDGQGPAFGVVLTATSSDPRVKVPSSADAGDIPSGQSRTVRIPVSVGFDVGDGQAAIEVQARDQRNFSSAPRRVIVPTSRLRRPVLSVEDYTLDASPASGASFHMNVLIRNSGDGPAIKPVISISNLPDELSADRGSHEIGTIDAGRTAEATLSFSIPRTWSAGKLAFRLTVVDGRGDAVGAASRDFSLNALTRTPRLDALVNMVSAGGGQLFNGDSVRLEIIPRNDGEMDATGVRIQVSAEGAVADPAAIDVGVVPAHQAQNPRQVVLRIPRTFRSPQLAVKVDLFQSDFPSRNVAQTIPVTVRVPRLRMEAFLRGGAGRLSVERGKTASLAVRISNEGDLAAENVVLRLEMNVAGVTFAGPTEIRLGAVAAHSLARDVEYPLRVYSSAHVGIAGGTLQVQQSEFEGVSQPLELEVLPQQAIVTRIGGEGESVPSPVPSPPLHARPTVAAFADSVVHGSTVELHAKVRDDRGIKLIAVEVNDVPVPAAYVDAGLRRKQGERGGEECELTLTITLPKVGVNHIVLKAINVENEPADPVVQDVNRLEDVSEGGPGDVLSPLSDVDTYIQSASTAAPDPRRWAVVIGVERYSRRGLPDALYARRDARAVFDYFNKILQVPENQIILLRDSEATKTGLDELIDEDLPNRIQNASALFFYFSGHGHPGAAGQDHYLMPYDANPHAIERTGISVKQLYQRLGALHAERKIVFLDACFTGNSSRSGEAKPLVEGSRPAYVTVDVAVPPGVVSFAAAKADQESNGYSEQSHGLFTYFLLKGLEARPRSVGQLATQVISGVSQQAGNRFGNPQVQTPVLEGDEHTPLVGP